MSIDISKLTRAAFIDAHYPEWQVPGEELYHDWSAAQIVETVASAGAQMMVFFAKDHFGNCYYPTDVGHRHRDIHDDFTGQVVDEARKHDLPIVIYYSAFADDYVARTHPEWRNQNPAVLNPVKPAPWGNVGFHQTYMDAYFIPQIREICERYRPDGLFFDTMGDAQPCPCAECRERFEAICGVAMDLDALAADPRPWETTVAHLKAQLYRQVAAAVEEISPDTVMMCGGYAEDPDAVEVLASVFNMDLYESTIHWREQYAGYLNAGIYARYYRTKARPVLANHYCFIGCWGELTTKPAAMLETEMLSTVSHGSTVAVADYLRPSGRMEPETFRRVGKVFEKIKALEPWLVAAQAVPHTAVLQTDGLTVSQQTVGAAKALIEGHRQFDIIDETALDRLMDDQAPYKVIIVPAPTRLWRPERWQCFADWIAAGGHAVIEGNELVAGEADVLRDILGIKDLSLSPFSSCYVKLDGRLTIAESPETPLLFHERPMHYACTTALPLCSLLDPIDEFDLTKGVTHRTSVLPPRRASSAPAITINECGAGKAVFVAASLARAYWCHSHPWLRDLLLAALELLDPNPLRVEAPGWVDANLMTVDGKLVLHLVQFCLNHGAGCEETFWHGHHYHLIEDVRPLFDIPFRVRTNRQPAAVTLVPSGGPLEFDYADGWVRAVLPRLDIHAAVCMAF